ncbi:AAA family ATPase [Eubacterium oxidoreducens]|uniref:Cytidylate kinase-like family protein n=1 Tax=Eubacterium oxidoreducens TaxID=1732 RepID=A0A1G6AV75_EUBOX|nr:cytidylate kinase-like family protein [Eubacterium oxidoreducens]SDB12296.1 Cytidylate kinase-like family protein [Eubacterium oxidoreducens]
MAKNKVICIGRQYGSDGRAIGKAVAEKLGIPYYDKELMEEAIKDTDLPKDILRKVDEKVPNSLFFEVFYEGKEKKYYGMNASEIVHAMQEKLILKKAQESSCVIIGRCADQILSDANEFPVDVLSIFICAPMEDRIKRVVKRESLDGKTASDLIRKTDKKRKNYYNYYTGKDWGKPSDYDVCINSSSRSREGTVNMICDLYEHIQEHQ